jgi:hypothetical protein
MNVTIAVPQKTMWMIDLYVSGSRQLQVPALDKTAKEMRCLPLPMTWMMV